MEFVMPVYLPATSFAYARMIFDRHGKPDVIITDPHVQACMRNW